MRFKFRIGSKVQDVFGGESGTVEERADSNRGNYSRTNHYYVVRTTAGKAVTFEEDDLVSLPGRRPTTRRTPCPTPAPVPTLATATSALPSAT